MLKKELEKLKKKHSENIRQAYTNIIKSDSKDYRTELEVILEYFGIDGKIDENTFQKQLDELKNKYDVHYRIVSLGRDWYKNSVMPLLVKHDNVSKAVIPDFMGKYCFYDNETKIHISDPTGYEERAICFYKGFGDGKVTRRGLVRYMLGCISPRAYVTVFVSMIIVMLFSLVMPQAEYYIFNNVIPSGTREDVVAVGALLLGIITISLTMYFIKEIIAANIPITMSANLQGAVVSRLLNLNMDFFNNQKSGKLSNSLLSISDLTNIFSASVLSAFVSFVFSGIYAARIKYYTQEFMGYVYISFVLVVVLVVLKNVFGNNCRIKFAKKLNDMSGFVYELFGSMENVKLNNADAVMLNRWSTYYADTLKAEKKPFIVKNFSGIYTFMISVLTLIIFRIGINNQTDTAKFIVFVSLYGLFIGSVGGIAEVLDAVSNFNSVYNELRDFFTAETEENTAKQPLDKFECNVDFMNVFYKYPDSGDYVLKNINFSFKKGEKIGIVGRSGCGKSTLLKLMLGFEKPDKGRIFIDNKDLNEINLSDYRRKLGVVLQSSRLIPADIFSNITLTYPEASADEVNHVVEVVGLREDIEKMPMGLHTFISDDNLTISVGQKQRILLARAIITNPSLLVLDEATNALDNITQSAISNYIAETDTTAVIVAHRLSTIKECDNIIVLGDGSVLQQGSYDELVKNKGVFYELVKNQL